VVLAASCVFAAPAWARAACGASEYSYAGLEASRSASGVAATLSPVSEPDVASGHVAGWIGLGGPGQGPNGDDEWIQVGLSAFPAFGNTIYYEVARPGEDPEYVDLDTAVVPGVSHRLAVAEVAGRANWWRVFVDRQPVSDPIHLPQSHGRWAPVATAESWNGGRVACNRYAYRFDRVSVATRDGGAGWQSLSGGSLLQDPGYRVIRSAPATFVATTLS
jgi:hypothetical protein